MFVLWSQVGGQGHLDLLPWTIKLALGLRRGLWHRRAPAAAVQGERAWNAGRPRMAGSGAGGLGVCAACASLYAHTEFWKTTATKPTIEATATRTRYCCT